MCQNLAHKNDISLIFKININLQETTYFSRCVFRSKHLFYDIEEVRIQKLEVVNVHPFLKPSLQYKSVFLASNTFWELRNQTLKMNRESVSPVK